MVSRSADVSSILVKCHLLSKTWAILLGFVMIAAAAAAAATTIRIYWIAFNNQIIALHYTSGSKYALFGCFW
jgi:hypothetical protein